MKIRTWTFTVRAASFYRERRRVARLQHVGADRRTEIDAAAAGFTPGKIKTSVINAAGSPAGGKLKPMRSSSVSEPRWPASEVDVEGQRVGVVPSGSDETHDAEGMRNTNGIVCPAPVPVPVKLS